MRNSPERLSRHWYDLTCLIRHDAGRSAISDRALLEDVVRHKKVFYNSGYARYDECLSDRLKLVPDDDDMRGLKADYRAMVSAGMLRAGGPEFDTLVERIRDVETAANRWP